ncbi:MAG TPA: iron-containing alcohol dehydrogenase [Thermoleophilaceae bacterium]|nr:iron-containing alcohol dehydrogenase [Thermoleophilaceae bacterium]
MSGPFTWIDGERLVRFGSGVLDEAPRLLAQRGFEGYALLTTERAEATALDLVGGADVVLHVPPGSVPDGAAAVLPGVRDRPLVALGGGRVVDVAKAVAGVEALPCAAIPTTLAGSPMTPFHRLPAGTRGGQLVRPSLVVWDPALAAGLGRAQLVATAMNALAHAFESLYVPHANPVAEMAALRAAELFGKQLPLEAPAIEEVALASLLAGYAVGTTGFAAHHALCQTTVRVAGLPHAQVNAVMLPHTAGLMVTRAPAAVGRLAAALGDPNGDPVNAPGRIARLTAETGVDGLAELGLDPDSIPQIAHAAVGHPALGNTPGGAPSEAELAGLLRAAL